MKKRLFMMGMFSMALTFGMTIVGCNNETASGTSTDGRVSRIETLSDTDNPLQQETNSTKYKKKAYYSGETILKRTNNAAQRTVLDNKDVNDTPTYDPSGKKASEETLK